MSFLINAYRNRTRSWVIDLFEADGSTPIVLAADDVVRVKIGRGNNATPTLELSSIASEALVGGSTVTFTAGTNDVTLKVCAADTASLETGSYDAEVLVVDNSDDDAPKSAEIGCFFLHPTMGGDVSEEESSSSSS